MAELLSGNEALALGAYHAGVVVAAAYPGTPSTEILETIARFPDIYAEWSTNEKVAMEVALGASYAGVRALAAMKHVGLNVASDPFMAASVTGIDGGLVVVSADDPGMHSSQNEQDNRHYARLAKVPCLEPSDSQEAYDFMAFAFSLSEEFRSPVMLRTTTRISHAKSVVKAEGKRQVPETLGFRPDVMRYVMVPAYARLRHGTVEERLVKLAAYAETSPLNQVLWGERSLGIIAGGVAYQYAREVFPKASFLKLGMTYPLSENLIRHFAAQVDRLVVIEELDPFLEKQIQAMGLKVAGKEFIPLTGELSPEIIAAGAHNIGLLSSTPFEAPLAISAGLPNRPPLLCPGCPHTGFFFVLSGIARRSGLKPRSRVPDDSRLIITGDIGCYTLGAFPPLNAMDTCVCMGASLGQAQGMVRAGVKERVVAVIGDSTFLHSGITSLVNAVYNQGAMTVVILDNGTTAMTGHQHHPGTGITAQGAKTQPVDIERLVRGIGVNRLSVVGAFDLKALRAVLKEAIASPELSVVVVRGACSVQAGKRTEARAVDPEKCTDCGACLMLGCPALRRDGKRAYIDSLLCVGDVCGLCVQVCPQKAIGATSQVAAAGKKTKAGAR